MKGGIIVGAVSLIFLWLVMHFTIHSPAIVKTHTIAHRGGAGLVPENTIAAIHASLSRDDQYIEIDVRRTADGVLILLHDNSVARFTDKNDSISELTWEEVSTLDAGSYFNSEYASETIPSLDEVLEVIAGSEVTLCLEVKDPNQYPGIEHQIAESIQKSNLTENVIVLSFNHKWLKEFRDVVPEVRVGWLCLWQGHMSHFREHDALSVFWGAVIADPTLVRRAHDSNCEVVVWTVNNPILARLLLWLGIDGITTDYPDRLAETLKFQ